MLGAFILEKLLRKEKKVDAPSQLLPGCELVIVGMIVWGSGLIVMYHIMRVFTIGGGWWGERIMGMRVLGLGIRA